MIYSFFKNLYWQKNNKNLRKNTSEENSFSEKKTQLIITRLVKINGSPVSLIENSAVFRKMDF